MKKKSKFLTFILSFIPGLGQVYLGFGTRGAMFFSSLIAIGLLMFIINQVFYNVGNFTRIIAIFIPIVWLAAIVDSMILVDRLNRNNPNLSLENSQPNSIIPDYRVLSGNNKKIVAMFLSILPGTGHLYLGLKTQGLEIMTSFFLLFYLADWLRLGILAVLIPIIWFYSMFDVMHKASEEGPLEDEDIFNLNWLNKSPKGVNKNKFFGISLISIGVILILNRIFIPIINRFLDQAYRGYIETTIVSIVLIIFGIKLLLGNKLNKEG